MYVYLAGPITNKTLAEASEWRDNPLLESSLAKHGYILLSPLRNKAHLERFQGPLPSRYEDDEERMEVDTDLDDIRNCAAVLANLRDDEHFSVGTCWELGYAYALGKPTITVIHKDGPYDHLFIHRTSTKVVYSLFEAAAELAILAPKLREPSYA